MRVFATSVWVAAGWLMGGTAAIQAQTVDFDSPAYAADKTFIGADQWSQAADPIGNSAENFRIQSGPGGKWAHLLTTGTLDAYRPFTALGGMLDVRWKWRPMSDSAHFCVGISGTSALSGVVPGGRIATRALACLEPHGGLSASGSDNTPTPSAQTWKAGNWQYLRLALDNTPGTEKFTFYVSDDSLRTAERAVLAGMPMGGGGNFARLHLRAAGGRGFVDLDDISWEAAAVWQGGGPDSNWSSARNWSGGVVPDSLTHVLLNAGTGVCFLDKSATVKSITVASTFKGSLNLGQQTLTVAGKGDFTGGAYVFGSNGRIRFASPRDQSLTGPEAGRFLAPVRHEGSGCLRVDRRPLYVAALEQVQGSFDFNGFDVAVSGGLTVLNGKPATFRNLDGRYLSVGGPALLEGTSPDTLLGLATSPQGWTLAGSGFDTAQARFGFLGNAHVTVTQGYASRSVDAGGNTGWIFPEPPAILSQPKDVSIKVGENGRFLVSASSQSAMSYQWLRNGAEIPGAIDSVHAPTGARKSDSGSIFTCRLANGNGNVLTQPARLLVAFPAPAVTPAPRAIADSLSINLIASAAGAGTRYSRNGEAWKEYAAPVLLKDSTKLRAFSVLAGDTSAYAEWIFPKQSPLASLAMPAAIPAGGAFTDSIVVRFASSTADPQASIQYLINGQGPFPFADSLILRETSALKAFAVSGSRRSDTAQWEFRRMLLAPVVSPKSRAFADTLRVLLAGKPGDATVRYTVNGSDPNPASAPFPGQGILLDSTTVLKTVTVRGADISVVASETYTLIPDPPTASPRGGDYGSYITIALKAKSARAILYYTLDGTDPGPDRGLPAYSAPFRLDTGATLKAVAVAGQGANLHRSAPLIEKYTFIRPGPRTLGPGQRIDLSGNYSLASPMAAAAPVNVEVIAADSLKFLKGFRDILFGMRLSATAGSAAFPKVIFNAPGGEPRFLYSLNASNPSGSARYISSADTAELAAPGTYFLAVDTLAPTLVYSGETFTGEDSTRLIVSIQDNVSNLLLDLDRSDRPGAGIKAGEISPMLLSVSLKNPEGALQPLTLRLTVDDHSRKAGFPPDGAAYPVAQRFSKPVRTPAAFQIGTRADNPWDLIAVPLDLEPPLTLAQLRQNNSAPDLKGASLDPSTGKYRYLDKDEKLLPGAGVWIAAPASMSSMIFPALKTAGHRGSGGFRLTLRKGWNLVANPTLSALYWPVTRAYPTRYDASLLKGLHAWDVGKRRYSAAEILEPWRGYFAYYKGGRDTTIDLSSKPVAAPSAKSASGSAGSPHASGSPGAPIAAGEGAAGFSFRLRLANGMSLRLGAAAAAGNGVGVEDEPQPLSPGDDGPRLYSDRENLRLETDLVRWSRGNLYAWKIVAGLPALGTGDRADSDPAAARLESQDLPEGYAVWAVSAKRGMRFPLFPAAGGAEDAKDAKDAEDSGSAGKASLPGGIALASGFTDTLDILAGPAAELEARLATIPRAVEAFGAKVSASAGSFALDLSLPGAASMRMALLTLDGRSLERDLLRLPEGSYRLIRNRGGRGYPSGMYVLSLDWIEAAAEPALLRPIPRRLALKIAIP